MQAAPFSARTNRTGFVFGGGVEWWVPESRWRARVEYLNYQFDGTENGSGLWTWPLGPFFCGVGGANGHCSATYSFGNVNIQTVRFGLSYALP